MVTIEQAFEAVSTGATVITVNRRLARSLRESYNQRQKSRGLKAWRTPDILPWQAWVRRCWDGLASEEIVLNAAQELLVWEQIVADSPEGRALLSSRSAARAAMEAWELCQAWRIPPGGPGWDGNEDTRAFQNWCDAFVRRCSSEGWLSSTTVADRLLTRVRATLEPPSQSVILAGFTELDPQQAELIQALRDALCKVEGLEPSAPALHDVRRVAFKDAAAEVEAAARWARALVEEGESRIAVLVPELQAMRAIVFRLFEDVLHPPAVLGGMEDYVRAFNLSLGTPLLEHPVVSAAFLVLQCGLRDLTLQETGGLLRSPFIAGAEAEMVERAQLDSALRRVRDLDVPFEKLLELSAGLAPKLAGALRNWRTEHARVPRVDGPSAWSAIFSRLLRAAGWPGERSLSSTEYQAVSACNDLLSEFAALDICAPELTESGAVSLLRTLASDTVFQPESEPAPVQILGLLEASGLAFDHVWIMGLHDDAWPRSARPNPCLPRTLQRELGLPHSSPSRELEFARRLTDSLVWSAPDVVLSYPQRDGDRDLRPSPLIHANPDLTPSELKLFERDSLASVIRRCGIVTPRPDIPPPALDETVWSRGGTRILQKQAACPFWAFAEFRLGAQALDAGEFGLGALDRGSALHSALEFLWNELRSHKNLTEYAPERIAGVIRSSVSRALDRLERSRNVLTPRFRAMEQARLERLLAAYLEIEKRRQPFEVVRPEGERYIEIGGVRIRTRIDRIDRLEQGREVIIDYKTTAPGVSGWAGERPDEPQLPLYAITHGAELAAVLFVQVKPGDVAFKGFARSAAVIDGIAEFSGARNFEADTWEGLMAEWRRVLTKLAADFKAGDARPDPKYPGETCKACGLTALCRAREWEQYCLPPEDQPNGE